MKTEISKKAQNMLNGFKTWLNNPMVLESMPYDNNKHMVKDCMSAKDAFSDLYGFENLRDECPLPYEQNDWTLVSNDTLWAEELIDKAFQEA